jgi:CheY-like chemotaxis protein
MSKSSVDPARGLVIDLDPEISATQLVDSTKAFVVGRSQINRVVVSKILEKTGLRPVSLDPEAAIKALHSPIPSTVILDGGPENDDCNALMAPLLALRDKFGKDAVCVLLLSTKVLGQDDLALLPAVDAGVAKPITPEGLTAVLERMRG